MAGGILGAVNAVGLGLLLPLLAASAVGAGTTRLLYPAYALAVGALLATRHRGLYPGFCLAAFAFAPFLRRILDYRAGWVAFNPVLLAPYAALLPTVLALARRCLLPGRRHGWAFAAIVACVFYGAILALVQGKVVSGLFEPLRWVLPVGLCAFVMECSPGEVAAAHRAVTGTLVAVTLILSAYGVAQYVDPPAWDVFWMQSLGISAGSFGAPEPFKIRPFSMMNSPGSFALYLATSVLALLGAGQVLVAIAGIAAVLLSIVRAGWLACAVGFAVLLLKASPRRRVSLLAAALVLGLVAASAGFGALQLLPEASESVATRLAGLSDLDKDTSAGERLHTYSVLFERLADAPLGEGVGANASMTSASDKQNLVPLDSGVLEVYLTFGVVAGTIWLVAMVTLVRSAWGAASHSAGLLAGYLGAVAGLVSAFPLGNSAIGEVSIVGWTGLGFLLASAETAARRGAR